MELEENGLNATLTVSILPSRQDMRMLGFTERSGATWWLSRRIGTVVTVELSIPKDGSPFRLDIVDEQRKFYDYQEILNHSPNNKSALAVQAEIESIFEFLSRVRIIHGFEKGMPIYISRKIEALNYHSTKVMIEL
jgi:hypothetical protein